MEQSNIEPDPKVAASLLAKQRKAFPPRYPNQCGVDRAKCKNDELAILRHWTYSTFAEDDAWAMSSKIKGFEFEIPDAFADAPRCPPKYDAITPEMFDIEYQRSTPRGHTNNLIVTAVHLDKFGKKKIIV